MRSVKKQAILLKRYGGIVENKNIESVAGKQRVFEKTYIFNLGLAGTGSHSDVCHPQPISKRK